MKKFLIISLFVCFFTACDDSEDSNTGDTSSGGGGGSSTVVTDTQEDLCSDVSSLLECRDEYRSLEVREWYHFLKHYLGEEHQYEFAFDDQTRAFECGALMSKKAREAFDDFTYSEVKEHLFDVYQLFINTQTCSLNENIENLIRKEINKE